jgi:hypothetical protein
MRLREYFFDDKDQDQDQEYSKFKKSSDWELLYTSFCMLSLLCLLLTIF